MGKSSANGAGNRPAFRIVKELFPPPPDDVLANPTAEKAADPAGATASDSIDDIPDFICLDFETADYQRDSACAMALIHVRGTQIVRSNYYLIRPPRRQFTTTHIHGIRWRDVEHAKTIAELWPEMMQQLVVAPFIAAHNASFEKSVLNKCAAVFGLPLPNLHFTCTANLARQALRIKPANLAHVCATLKIPLDHHNAVSDATACAHIIFAARQRGHRV